MRHSNGARLHHELRTTLRVDPSLVLRSKVLELTEHELRHAIEMELNDNPALERLDDDLEAVTEDDALQAVAPEEFRLRQLTNDALRPASPGADEAPDWVDMASAPVNLRDHLQAQLAMRVTPELEPVAAYVVDSLNERGMLDVSDEELALALNVSIETIQDVVAALQTCEPAGVGARTVPEMLLLQLRGGETLEHRLARHILRDHLDDLIARRTQRISRRFRVLPSVVEATFQMIQELNPNPVEGFSLAPSSLMLAHHVAVAPDLILRHTEQGWEIEPRGADPSMFRIAQSYKQRLAQLKRAEGDRADERAHLAEFATRAEQFIQSLRDRRRTLRRIGEYLVEAQQGYALTGRYEFLQPLTRTQLARRLGIHESTVSRATMNKFVQIATGDVVPFDVFFKPALRVQKMIEEILAQENPHTPLSDEQIARLLAQKGVHVARRTVNKYRDRRRMLNSRARRSA